MVKMKYAIVLLVLTIFILGTTLPPFFMSKAPFFEIEFFENNKKLSYKIMKGYNREEESERLSDYLIHSNFYPDRISAKHSYPSELKNISDTTMTATITMTSSIEHTLKYNKGKYIRYSKTDKGFEIRVSPPLTLQETINLFLKQTQETFENDHSAIDKE